MDDRQYERFMAKVDQSNDCWLWTAGLHYYGYGQFYLDPQRRSARAHVVSYEHFVGPIPEGLEIDHLCEKPACVNPAHLEAVPHRVNLLRSAVIGERAGRTHCINGHEYTLENTYIRKDRGTRQCKTCGNERNLARYHARMRHSE